MGLDTPPSVRRRRRAKWAVVTAVTLAVVAVLADRTVFREHAQSAQEARSARILRAVPAAAILSIKPGGLLALSTIRDSHAKTLTALGQMTSPPIPGVDGRYLAAPYGEVLSFDTHNRPMIAHTKLTITQNMKPAQFGPFANHDQFAVLLDSPYGAPTTTYRISVESLATGKSLPLGTVAGDPQSAGVFTSVASPISSAAAPTRIFPDSSVELRVAGKPSFLIAAAGQLNRDLRRPPGTPEALSPFPDPAGSKVAIEVQPASAYQLGGIVLMTRTGHVITTFGGPIGAGYPAWSPSGNSLTFATAGSPGPRLHTWSAGGHAITEKLPAIGNYGACLWSPDGAWILCTLVYGRKWVITSASGGPMLVTQGPGYPLAWLGNACEEPIATAQGLDGRRAGRPADCRSRLFRAVCSCSLRASQRRISQHGRRQAARSPRARSKSVR